MIYALLKSHEPVDLLILMLGTNDTKDRLNQNAACIGLGLQRLILKAKSTDCWGSHEPNILIVCPPPIGRAMNDAAMGTGCAEKAEALPAQFEAQAKLTGCHYMDAAGCTFNTKDYMHLSRKGHAELAERLAALVPTLL